MNNSVTLHFIIGLRIDIMEENGIRLTFPAMFNETLRKFGKSNAYAFVGEEPKSYETVNQEIKVCNCFS